MPFKTYALNLRKSLDATIKELKALSPSKSELFINLKEIKESRFRATWGEYWGSICEALPETISRVRFINYSCDTREEYSLPEMTHTLPPSLSNVTLSYDQYNANWAFRNLIESITPNINTLHIEYRRPHAKRKNVKANELPHIMSTIPPSVTTLKLEGFESIDSSVMIDVLSRLQPSIQKLSLRSSFFFTFRSTQETIDILNAPRTGVSLKIDPHIFIDKDAKSIEAIIAFFPKTVSILPFNISTNLEDKISALASSLAKDTAPDWIHHIKMIGSAFLHSSFVEKTPKSIRCIDLTEGLPRYAWADHRWKTVKKSIWIENLYQKMKALRPSVIEVRFDPKQLSEEEREIVEGGILTNIENRAPYIADQLHELFSRYKTINELSEDSPATFPYEINERNHGKTISALKSINTAAGFITIAMIELCIIENVMSKNSTLSILQDFNPTLADKLAIEMSEKRLLDATNFLLTAMEFDRPYKAIISHLLLMIRQKSDMTSLIFNKLSKLSLEAIPDSALGNQMSMLRDFAPSVTVSALRSSRTRPGPSLASASPSFFMEPIGKNKRPHEDDQPEGSLKKRRSHF
ncbi:MAG: hypothetical protein P1U63_08110 [Coxiellaceae bacterium]|nr:hypothetical protein [Coxiellaceae bacterium]